MATSGRREADRRLHDRLVGAGADARFLPFDRFMDAALYDPLVGYYAREPSPLGVAGDFYTAPQLHPLFGATVGRHVARLLAGLGEETPLRLVELGPGDGELAVSIVAELAATEGPPVEYALIERSSARAATARQRVALAAEGTRVRPSSPSTLGEGGPFRGIVVGHEFWDAQPVRRFRYTRRGWDEIGVRREGEGWTETVRPLAEEDRPGELPSSLEEGSVLEISPRAEATLREIADHLVEGRGLFIDFGGEEEEILRAHRFGTLTAVEHHQVLSSPLERPGEVDLSAYVNFTRLRRAAARAGLEWLSDRPQSEALVAWGLEDAKRRWEEGATPAEAVRGHLALKKLLFGFPQFRAIELAAGSGRPRSRDPGRRNE